MYNEVLQDSFCPEGFDSPVPAAPVEGEGIPVEGKVQHSSLQVWGGVFHRVLGWQSQRGGSDPTTGMLHHLCVESVMLDVSAVALGRRSSQAERLTVDLSEG